MKNLSKKQGFAFKTRLKPQTSNFFTFMVCVLCILAQIMFYFIF